MCVLRVRVISTNTQSSNKHNHTLAHTQIKKQTVHTVWAQWWQVLVPDVIVVSVSLIRGGRWWRLMKVRVCFHKKMREACQIKACCFVGKAPGTESVLKCEVMRRMLDLLRQSISKWETAQMLTRNVTLSITNTGDWGLYYTTVGFRPLKQMFGANFDIFGKYTYSLFFKTFIEYMAYASKW